MMDPAVLSPPFPPVPRLLPEPPGDGERVQPHVVPPGAFVADIVQLAVVRAAERHGELVANLGAERLRLSEADVMRIRGGAAAQDARL
jgi:hypothetical protein